MLDNQVDNERDGYKARGEAINELGFTYKRLLRLLPAIFRRTPEPRLAQVLNEQYSVDAANEARLTKVAVDLGQPAAAFFSEEADTLVGDVYNAERAGTTPVARTWGIVQALMAVRIFLIRTWARVMANVHLEQPGHAAIHAEAVVAQQQEADQHRQLTALTEEIENQRHQTVHGAGGK